MKSRFLSLALLFSSISFFGAGCAEPTDEALEQDENQIVNVDHTDVERQAIGNCWIYAHATWAESMHKSATGKAFDISQSYWTYWHWFDQIAGGFTDEVQTGGTYGTANGIVKRYGLMAEKDFISADTQAETSTKQKQALDAINLSLKSGALSDFKVRRDKKAVRAELDKAWGLSAAQTAMLDQVFGTSVTKTFTGSANNAGTTIMKASEFPVAYSTGPGKPMEKKTLATAMVEWREAFYSRGDKRFVQRTQRALHEAAPVIITWRVDFNALENNGGPLRGSFNIDTLKKLGPGKQGGHMTVIEDYEATLADGTLLKAGETLDPKDPSDKKLLDAALSPSTQVKFFRVKNSWGTARPDRAFAPGMPGYHDLYMNYLDGPIKHCMEGDDGNTDPTNCPFDSTPLQNVVLPPGF